jgi:hypothetical protein
MNECTLCDDEDSFECADGYHNKCVGSSGCGMCMCICHSFPEPNVRFVHRGKVWERDDAGKTHFASMV